MSGRGISELVLAIYPCARGVTFTLFEGPLSPVDWGTKRTRGLRAKIDRFDTAKALIDRYQPDVLVLPRRGERADARPRRVDRLTAQIVTYAAAQAIDCYRYSRRDIRDCFRSSGAFTRRDIAGAIAAHVPAFDRFVPRARKFWEGEDERMSLFDAASLVMTYFCFAAVAREHELSS